MVIIAWDPKPLTNKRLAFGGQNSDDFDAQDHPKEGLYLPQHHLGIHILFGVELLVDHECDSELPITRSMQVSPSAGPRPIRPFSHS